MRVGLLLPHFGPHSTYDRVFSVPQRLEALGFSSVWVRDQLGFRGGMRFEPRSTHFIDPLVVLAAVASSTELVLGTATLTPIRHPVVLAQAIGSLAYVANGRLVLGIGLGGDPRAYELAGLDFKNRIQLFEDTINVLRLTAGQEAQYSGHTIQFDRLSLNPAPPADLPLWYCGSSLAAVRRAVKHMNGWFPGRCPLRVFDRLAHQLHALAADAGKKMTVATVPIVSIADTREKALAKVNVSELLADARGKPAWTRDGPFSNAADLEGALIAGRPDDIIADLKQLESRGVVEVVIDLRLRMDEFEEAVEVLGRDVIPAFQA